MRYLIIAAVLAAVTIPPARAFAHGVVGDYIFLEPLVAEDPTPANEFDIVQPSWVKSAGANTYGIGFSGEKVLYIDDNYMPTISIGGGSSWQHVSPFEGHGQSGFDDLELFGKWAFYYSLKHEFLASFVVTSQIPTGSTEIEEQNHTSVGPELLMEKGLGDLPNLPYLK